MTSARKPTEGSPRSVASPRQLAALARHGTLHEFNAALTARLAAGLAPHATLGKDLAASAKRAGLPRERLLRRALTQCLASPGLPLASDGFWRHHLLWLRRLITDDQLAQLAPERIDSTRWLQLLRQWGLLERIARGEVDRGRWVAAQVANACQRPAHYPKELCAFVRSLPLAGATVRLPDQVAVVHPELIDAVLAAGAKIHVAGGGFTARWDFVSWARQPAPPDLVALANSPLAEQAAQGGLGLCVRRYPRLLAGRPGTAQLLRRWATPQPDTPLTGLWVDRSLLLLDRLCSPFGAEVVPEELAAYRRLLDAPELLAEGLRQGLWVELAWPALEAAAARLRASHPDADLELHEAWPAVGVSAGGEMIWVADQAEVDEARCDVTGWDAPETVSGPALGRIDRPGGGRWFRDEYDSLLDGEHLTELPDSCDLAGNRHLLERLPRAGWRHLRPRHPQASARLRALTRTQAEELLLVAPTLAPCGLPEEGDQLDALTQRVVELLGTADPALVEAVAWQTIWVKDLVAEANEMLERAVPRAGLFDRFDTDFTQFLDCVSPPAQESMTREDILAVGERCRDPQRPLPATFGAILWLPATRPEALLELAATPGQTRRQVEGLAATVGAVVDAGLATEATVVFGVAEQDECLAGVSIDTPTGPALGIGDIGGWCAFLSPGGGVPPAVNGEPVVIMSKAVGTPLRAVIDGFDRLLSDGPRRKTDAEP